ncbi:hypothetical protein [Vibrio mediterranei]|uniref:hypothetical protein n=1 Tax=Vibrio mediterranei TaxID=689 RepID=UPI00148E5ED1|nr:hypothetical protein [Vibrio mediterranei]NOH30428.1 hypothetical protein [Vibrio mediterranei]
MAGRARGYYRIDGVEGLGCQYKLDICHLYPAAGEYVTALSADNLVVMDSSVNRKLGSKDYGFPSAGVLKSDATEVQGRENQMRFLTEVFELEKLVELHSSVLNQNTSKNQFTRYPIDELRVAMYDAHRTAEQAFRYRDDIIEDTKVFTLMPEKDADGKDVSEYETQEIPENDSILSSTAAEVLTGTDDGYGIDAYKFITEFKHKPLIERTRKDGTIRYIDPNDHESLRMALGSLM